MVVPVGRPLSRHRRLCPDLAQGLRLPVKVALHGGDAAEHGRLRQLGEVEVAEFDFEPLDEAEAESGLSLEDLTPGAPLSEE